ncbi:MAG: ribonuclease J [Gammaproteobacteria bacterium]|nr:ribonuclease J [Gammaproteobacteria bacterium]
MNRLGIELENFSVSRYALPNSFRTLSVSEATTPTIHDLWLLPLGGCGEIGMNLNLYGHNGRWLMVDCGVTFNKTLQQNSDVNTTKHQIIAADPQFIASRKQLLDGMIITHAHEDHVGAVAFLWRRFKCPIYTNAFTAEVLNRKLAENGLLGRVPVHVISTGTSKTIGVFDVEWIPLTHSIPEPQALVIKTPAGKVFHTADWKLDAHPVVGNGYRPETYQNVGLQNIDAMVCDSTNATEDGWSTSEGALEDGLFQLIKQQKGRVIVACFGSNVARLQTLIRVANKVGRYCTVLGRSLENMIGCARNSNMWPDELEVVPSAHIGYLPKEEVLVIATGSQGEPKTALHRLAHQNHFALDLEEGDSVIFSSRTIPGNEAEVESLLKKLEQLKVNVFQANDAELPIHASGHPHQEELKAMYRWIKPRIAIPVHGEDKHLTANASIAREVGVKHQLVGKNGDIFQIAPYPGVRRQVIETGMIEIKRP